MLHAMLLQGQNPPEDSLVNEFETCILQVRCSVICIIDVTVLFHLLIEGFCQIEKSVNIRRNGLLLV